MGRGGGGGSCSGDWDIAYSDSPDISGLILTRVANKMGGDAKKRHEVLVRIPGRMGITPSK